MAVPGPVHPTRPEVAGFCFSETHGFGDAYVNRLAAKGKVWVTRFRALTHDGRVAMFGGDLIAETYSEAEAEAKRRGLGEVVVGTLEMVGRL